MSSSRLVWKLAVLALVCYGVYDRWAPGDDRVIEVTPASIHEVTERQEALVGRSLDAAERLAAREDYIDEEILVREAFRRGLDRGDRQIRSLLFDHAWRELLEAAHYVPPTPSESELRSYFEASSANYGVPERIDLQQVLFLAGTAPAEPGEVLEDLESGADFTAIGDAGTDANVEGVTRSRIARALGLDFANQIFDLPAGVWQGPFTSSAGTHFVRIQQRSPARESSFAEVRAYVEEDLLAAAENRAVEASLVGIGRRYRVELEDVD